MRYGLIRYLGVNIDRIDKLTQAGPKNDPIFRL